MLMPSAFLRVWKMRTLASQVWRLTPVSSSLFRKSFSTRSLAVCVATRLACWNACTRATCSDFSRFFLPRQMFWSLVAARSAIFDSYTVIFVK